MLSFRMLIAFFDDSGTHQEAPVVAFGGVLGEESQLEAFDAAWRALLKSPLPGKTPLKQFHAVDCRHGQGEFLDYRPAERDRLFYLFRQLIFDHRLWTIAASVDKRAWIELLVGGLVEKWGAPEEYCFVRCIDTAIELNKARLKHAELEIVFDGGLWSTLGGWAKHFEAQKSKYPEITGIGFAPVHKLPPLQAADMVAYETFLYAQRWLGEGPDAAPRPHFNQFLRGERSVGLILDRTEIGRLAAMA